MADSVIARLIADGIDSAVVRLTGISDGTGETGVKKVDIATVAQTRNASGALVAPVSLDIAAARWAIQGYTSVRLLWDHTTDDAALVLAGSGYDDFIGPLGLRGGRDIVPLLTDPRSAGGDGSLLLTSAGAVSGATYDITLWLRKAGV